MYVRVVKVGGRQYVHVVSSYRNEKGQPRTKVEENLGRLDKLLANDPDALTKLKAKYQATREVQNQLQAQKLQQLLAPSPLSTGTLDQQPLPVLCYGQYPLKVLWNQDLALPRKINYLQKTRSRCTFSLNETIAHLCFSKVMHPASILGTHLGRDQYLGHPLAHIELRHLYECLDFLAQNKEEIFRWINRRLDVNYGADRATLVLYDVTNAYFETAMTDAERLQEQDDFPEQLQTLALQAQAEGVLSAECFDEQGQVIAEALPASFVQQVAQAKIQYLRMRGPSKEHRFDLPLVSIALVIDKHGLPMDFAVFAGNASEFTTMTAAIEALQKKYALKQAIVMADRGLNSCQNLQMLQDKKLGFLMAQRITQFPRSLQDKMLDLRRYRPLDERNPAAGRYQVISNWKRVGADKKAITCTLVLTFDEKRQRRDEAILNLWADLVRKKQEAGVKLGPRKTGWAALAKTAAGVEQPILGVDEEALAQRRKLCGFAAVIYKAAPLPEQSQPQPVHESPWQAQDIARAYHQQNAIEACFRVLKSTLKLRPMFVWKSNHIRGYITVCMLSLLLLTLLADKLKKQNGKMSYEQISRTLRQATVVPLPMAQDINFLHVGRIDSTLTQQTQQLSPQEWQQRLAQGQWAEGSGIAQIMTACGLTPLSRLMSKDALARALGTRFKTVDDALSPLSQALVGVNLLTTKK